MAKDLLRRYIWIVDLLHRYGSLSREEIDKLWMRSPLGKGEAMPPRTFYHYRRAIEDNFNIEIRCNQNGEYYIAKSNMSMNEGMLNLMLDSYAVNSAVQDSKISPACVLVEEVPSARDFLPIVLDAIGHGEVLKFTYASFSRSLPETDIYFAPYFVKRYKQRWYMIGQRKKRDGGNEEFRTYALDRIKEMKPTDEKFTPPEDLDPAEMFSNTIGVTISHGELKTVKIRTTPQQAKYLRALPFHHTQQEELSDGYSIFTYRLTLNYELVHELLSFGPSVTILEPQELRLMVATELADSLRHYSDLLPLSGLCSQS